MDKVLIPRSRAVAFAAIASIGCLSDLWTKHWVFAWRGLPRPNNVFWLWEGYVGIEPALNTGALFGFGAGNPAFLIVFVVASLVATVAILVWLFGYGAACDWILTCAMACLMAGILGNLHDRLGLWADAGLQGVPRHAVRDWILLCYGPYTWPNFNLADSFLVCGAGMLAWHGFRNDAPVFSGAPRATA